MSTTTAAPQAAAPAISDGRNASAFDRYNDISMKLWHARSLAHFLVGDGGQALRLYNEDIRDGVRSLLSELIEEISQKFDALPLPSEATGIAVSELRSGRLD